ncbi:hypothetical protein B0J13DRAFT_586124 [Dactylonectria estremocensis]|uniref:PD-(D/E)XK nuclease-like domain-containing protein n=1 Tax=Dactylonectria estremocensis TaxID=1079267 RepID=A0A9P9ENJ2_9HYPO|nr:hypothetical protein B0J13DRAFT_586124 [Dactylonectria estremocensis]
MSNDGSPAKRIRHDLDLDLDPDATPTKPRAVAVADSDVSSEQSWSSAASASRLKRSRSGRASPTKGLAFLRIEHIIDHRSFGGKEAPPAALKELVRRIKQDASGTGILSALDMERMQNNPHTNSLFDDILDASHIVDTTGRREQLGRLPGIDTLIEIWEDAQECELDGHSEASWNCAVHFPLLRAALRLAKVNQPDGQKQPPLQIKAFNVYAPIPSLGLSIVLTSRCSSTAKVAKPYTTSTIPITHDKRVDFCFCIKPDKASPLADSLYRVAQQSAHLSVNHTDYTPLINSPISLSIETKRTGEDWQTALEQISTWMAGHWRRLEELATSGPRKQAAENLQFLPGIIIQGHDWFFIAATRGRIKPLPLISKVDDSASFGVKL